MKFTCKINMDTTAFQGGNLYPSIEAELAYLLRVIADENEQEGLRNGSVVDSNGTFVGHWEIEEVD